MNFHFRILVTLLTLLIILSGCTTTNPVEPDPITDAVTRSGTGNTSTLLWGYYQVDIDPVTQTVTGALNRDLMYTVNVNLFLNNNPPLVSFDFNGLTSGDGYIDVNLNVSITHPLPGLTKFNGYDVRGVLIGNGSGIMELDPDITYPILGVDQYLLNSDGYTRWFNKGEFLVQGLFGFTPGIYGTPDLTGSATINGYKYFADGIGPYDNACDMLKTNDGIFSSGSTNTRNYLIRFPVPSPGLKYDYAVIADWSGGQPEDHPSHSAEAVAANIDWFHNPYYSPTAGGGGDVEFNLGLSSFDNFQPSYIGFETSVTADPIWHDMSMEEPWEVDNNFASWHFKFPADDVLTTTGNELIAVIEYAGFDHTNPFDIPNSADTSLAAFFRFGVPVDDAFQPNQPPIITLGVEGSETTSPDAFQGYFMGAMDPDNDEITYWWTVTNTLTFDVVMEEAGDGPGTLFVYWGTDIVAAIGEIYTVDCSASDSINPPVMAQTLTVTVVE